MFKHILVATDLGRAAERAVELAVSLAASEGAELSVLHVFEIPAYVYPGEALTPVDCLGPMQESAQKHFDAHLEEIRRRAPLARGIFRIGNAWEQILATIEEAAPDLVVVGTHGHTGVAHALLGSVAERVVRMSPVPVLTVRRGEAEGRRRSG